MFVLSIRMFLITRFSVMVAFRRGNVVSGEGEDCRFPFDNAGGRRQAQVRAPIPRSGSTRHGFHRNGFSGYYCAAFFSYHGIRADFAQVDEPHAVGSQLIFFRYVIVHCPAVAIFGEGDGIIGVCVLSQGILGRCARRVHVFH